VFDARGNVVRSHVAALVFGESPDAPAARADLNAISHPVIGRLASEQIAELQRVKAVQWILIDAALLLEAGWHENCDAVVFVEVSPKHRAERVFQQRGWTEPEWKRREQSQWPLARKRSAAQIVVSNDGSEIEAAQELQRALERRFRNCE
jgi:dephospho-CoA kinase